MGHNTSPNKRLYASWIFSNGPSALEFQIDFSNLALINRVYSGQASSINTDYPTSVKPRTLAVSVTDNKTTMKRIVLISCVSRKGTTKSKARELYKGPLFTSSLAYGISLNPDKIFILSALHQLLNLDTEIEPYNVTLSNIPKSKRKADLKILTSKEKLNGG